MPGTYQEVEMAQDSEKGLRLTDRLALVVIAVFAVMLAFWVFSFVAGLVWGLVKLAIVVALVLLVLRLLMGRRR
jgi:hypothetical protein